LADIESIELRHRYAQLTEVRLHCVEAGEGPLVILLHGFPEGWFGWRFQIAALAAAGFRVVAPDMRGYNLSSRPAGVASYRTDHLAGDVRDLIHECGADRACVAGHDWGAAAAWVTAMNHPEVVERLAILNLPHPRRLLNGLRDPRQLVKSWYVFFFQLPGVSERFLRAGGWWFFRRWLREVRPGAFPPEEIEKYVQAWEQPGAATAMLNYYRAGFRQPPKRAKAQIRPVEAPTLVIWGQRDRHLRASLAEPSRDDVPNLVGLERLPEASHWVQHDEPERVSALLAEFFGAAPTSPARA
jgi:pimeloyl-ACP methyl ester carboxylesterase